MCDLIYFRNWKTLECESTLTSITHTSIPTQMVLLFDKTVFYPSSGGQPSDIGTALFPSSTKIIIKKVTFSKSIKNQVEHLVEISDPSILPTIGTKFNLFVDRSIRDLHSRIHSAGHVIDGALEILKIPLKVDIAYHYPEGPCVSYNGTLNNSPKDELQHVIQEHCQRLIANDLKVFIEFANDDPKDCTCERRMRISGVVSIPCGGTHVNSLGEIGKLTIRKIETKSGKVRICYKVE